MNYAPLPSYVEWSQVSTGSSFKRICANTESLAICLACIAAGEIDNIAGPDPDTLVHTARRTALHWSFLAASRLVWYKAHLIVWDNFIFVFRVRISRGHLF